MTAVTLPQPKFYSERSYGMKSALLVIMTAFLLTLQGCATGVVEKPRTPELNALDYTGKWFGNSDIKVSVIKSVLPGDKGFFPKTEQWGEYIVEVTTGPQALSVTSAVLLTSTNTPISMARSSGDLTKAPNVDAMIMTTTATTAAAAAGALLIAVPFVGPALMAGAMVANSQTLKSDNSPEYHQEFLRKTRAEVPYLEANSKTVFSVFFPLIKDANAFALEYSFRSTPTQSKRIELSVKGFSNTSGESSDRSVSQEVVEPKDLPGNKETSGKLANTPGNLVSTREAQLILNRLKYDAGPADGVAGVKTKDAIRKFQLANGLPATGLIDQKTSNLLRAN
jgi:hypothetical protein